MNKFSTLFASVCSLLIASTASAQVTQSFDTQAEVNTLTFNCWNFTNAGFTDVTPLSNTGSIMALESPSSLIATPLLDIPTNNLTINFSYKVLSIPNGNNKILVQMVDAAGTKTLLETITLNRSTNNIAYTGQFPSNKPNQANNINGSKRVVIEVVNSVVLIDDLYTNANPTAGACIGLSPMPVKLINFQGSINNNKGQLKWAVADNETGDHFQVMRSTDGRNFTEAGTVFINGKVGAESYSFSDAMELAATTFYQLKIVNKNGSIAYSNIITLKSAAAKQAASLTILQNPVAATLSFSYAATSAGKTNLSIYTTSGVKVYSNRISSVKGTNAVSLPLDRHIAPGTYILEVSNGTERNVAKMVKQ